MLVALHRQATQILYTAQAEYEYISKHNKPNLGPETQKAVPPEAPTETKPQSMMPKSPEPLKPCTLRPVPNATKTSETLNPPKNIGGRRALSADLHKRQPGE